MNQLQREEKWEQVHELTSKLRASIYKELADSAAVKQLEKFIYLNGLWTDGSFSLFDSVETNYREGAPYPYDLSDMALDIFRDAMVEMDGKFFENFGKAIQKRNKVKNRDQVPQPVRAGQSKQ